MYAVEPRDANPGAETLRVALRDIHAPSLHGFALLLTLGDRHRAAALTAAAFAAADARAEELRHPERAAAWLRAEVTRRAGRRDSPIDVDERLAALGPIGVTAPVLAGLASLDRHERAALVASWVERIDPRDVATIVGRQGDRLETLLRRARSRFLDGHAAAAPDRDAVTGPLADAVRSAAARAMA
jgi:DNA-directed RNA polymerase specialized sigma24 family protein